MFTLDQVVPWGRSFAEYEQLFAIRMRAMRVFLEARIFPLLMLDGFRSPFIDACVAEAKAAGAVAEIVWVPYELQRGGNEMLRVRRGAAAA